MNLAVLEILRCPFCGWQLKIEPSPVTEITGDELQSGILGCGCCPYPVVAGIPYLRTPSPTARTALRFLNNNHKEQALQTLLGLDDSKMNRLQELQKQKDWFTYRDGLRLLSPDLEGTNPVGTNPEGTYFI